MASRQKPTVTELGVDIATLEWQRSGVGDGSFEVAFVADAGRPAEVGGPAGQVRAVGTGGLTRGRPGQARPADASTAQWILLRVAGDPAGRLLVYDRVEWLCFIDGARGGEFDPGRAEREHGGQARGSRAGQCA